MGGERGVRPSPRTGSVCGSVHFPCIRVFQSIPRVLTGYIVLSWYREVVCSSSPLYPTYLHLYAISICTPCQCILQSCGDGGDISMMSLAPLTGQDQSVPEAVERGSLALALGLCFVLCVRLSFRGCVRSLRGKLGKYRMG